MRHIMPADAHTAGFTIYRWRYGDTLENVAEAHGATEQAVRNMNPNLDFSDIAPGVPLRMPAPGLTCPIGALHTLRPGDTIASVARAFGISAGALMDHNPYLDPRELKPGHILCVPQRPPAEALRRMRVLFGQSVSDILAAHNMTLDEFERANPNLKTDRLTPGQTYYVI